LAPPSFRRRPDRYACQQSSPTLEVGKEKPTAAAAPAAAKDKTLIPPYSGGDRAPLTLGGDVKREEIVGDRLEDPRLARGEAPA